jgi:hypothetical protein
MNEQEQIKQFNQAVDAMLNNGKVPEDQTAAVDPQLLAIAQTLATTDLSDESQQLASIRQRLITQASSQPVRKTWSLQRTLLNTAAAFVLIVLAFMTIPPLQVLAQQVLSEIGRLQFTNQMTIPEQMANQPASDNPNVGQIEPVVQLNPGFTVYEPAYLPAGYRFVSRHISGGESETYQSIRSDYTLSQPTNPDFISLTQWQFAENSTVEQPLIWAIGSAETTAVTVNGQDGFFVANAPTGQTVNAAGDYEILGVNILAWEQGGYLFTLQSFQISLDEMQQIAASLQPVSE